MYLGWTNEESQQKKKKKEKKNVGEWVCVWVGYVCQKVRTELR